MSLQEYQFYVVECCYSHHTPVSAVSLTLEIIHTVDTTASAVFCQLSTFCYHGVRLQLFENSHKKLDVCALLTITLSCCEMQHLDSVCPVLGKTKQLKSLAFLLICNFQCLEPDDVTVEILRLQPGGDLISKRSFCFWEWLINIVSRWQKPRAWPPKQATVAENWSNGEKISICWSP